MKPPPAETGHPHHFEDERQFFSARRYPPLPRARVLSHPQLTARAYATCLLLLTVHPCLMCMPPQVQMRAEHFLYT